MTEKRLARLAAAVVLWFVVVTPYLIPFPPLPKGDLTVDDGTRGVVSTEGSVRDGEEKRGIEDEHGVGGPLSIAGEESMGEPMANSGIRGELIPHMIGTTPSTGQHQVRGTLIEGGERTEILLSLKPWGRRDLGVRKNPVAGSPPSKTSDPPTLQGP